MRNPILLAQLADFSEQHDFTELTESEQFERFANFCTISKYDPDLDLDDVSVGSRGDLALDGIAIVVNDHVVASIEAVDYFKRLLRRLDVQFIFVQARPQYRFSAADFSLFIQGVRRFLEAKCPVDANKKVSALHAVKEHIIARSADMESSPICRMFYVTTGKWTGDVALQSLLSRGIDDLRATDIFSACKLPPLTPTNCSGSTAN